MPELLQDRVLSDRQVQLVASQQQSSHDGVRHQVEAGSHDDGDEAKVDGGTWQRPGTLFQHLKERVV